MVNSKNPLESMGGITDSLLDPKEFLLTGIQIYM